MLGLSFLHIVIDFGLSKKFLDKPGMMTERVGTVYTMAPQVLQGVYSMKADCWSIGCITYMLLSSSKPFYDKRRPKMIDKIMRAKYNFDAPVWKHLSDECQDFIRHLIVVDPKKRATAEQALQHEWIVGRAKLPEEIPSEAVLKACESSILNYAQTSTLKKLALTVIAHRSSNEDIKQLRAVFDKADTVRNGVLTMDEFTHALKDFDYTEEEVQQVFESMDINKNGEIQYTEVRFCCFLLECTPICVFLYHDK